MKSLRKIIVLGLLLLLPSCLGWFMEKPAFTLKEIDITHLSPTQMNFILGIEVQNPNPFIIKLSRMDYAVYINGEEAGRGRIEKEVQIAKSSSTLVQVPLQANFKILSYLLGAVLVNQNVQYKIEGAAVVKAALRTATVPFSKTGEINLKK